jgi:hypothetical protein
VILAFRIDPPRKLYNFSGADLRLWPKTTDYPIAICQWISPYYYSTAALPTTTILQAHSIYVSCAQPFPHFVCLVAFLTCHLPTAEWSDVQLSFDVGGGRYLEPRMLLALPLEVHTCQWADCSNAFDDFNTFIRHLHEGAPDFRSSLGFLVPPPILFSDPTSADHIGVHKSEYTCEWATCLRRGRPQTRSALLSHLQSHTGQPLDCEFPGLHFPAHHLFRLTWCRPGLAPIVLI